MNPNLSGEVVLNGTKSEGNQ